MAAYDAIVLGLGAMGSAAAWRLAARGQRVLGLEAFDLVHERGSSHGRTRICRKAYFEHPDYVPLLQTAYGLWDELSEAARRELLVRCGLLLAGEARGAVIAGTRSAARLHKLPLEELSAAEAAGRFPGLRIPDGLDVLFEAEAGLLHVEACVAAQLEQARRCGAELLPRQCVRSWSAARAGVEVVADGQRWSAQRLIIAAGAWSSAVLADLRLPLRIERRPQVWFPTADRQLALSAGCPVYGFHLGDRFFYGFPELGDGLVKVAEHLKPDAVEGPDALDRALHPGDVAPLAEFVERCLPGVEPRPARHSVCMYTMSPDEHFIIDVHPEYANVAFAAGFSGHGFKFAPLVGEVLSDLVLTGRSAHAVGFLRASRFTRTTPPSA